MSFLSARGMMPGSRAFAAKRYMKAMFAMDEYGAARQNAENIKELHPGAMSLATKALSFQSGCMVLAGITEAWKDLER